MNKKKATVYGLRGVLAVLVAASMAALPAHAFGEDASVVVEQSASVVETAPNDVTNEQPIDNPTDPDQGAENPPSAGEDLSQEQIEAPLQGQTDANGQGGEIAVVEDAATGEPGGQNSATLVTQANATKSAGELHVAYTGHVQKRGWQDWMRDGTTAGTFGESLRVEAMRIRLEDGSGAVVPGVSYQAHVQRIGWQDWVSDSELCGTSGRSLRVEALRLKLSDELAANYNIWYRLHVQSYGWLDWACNGSTAGTSSLSRRVEAIEIRVLPKGQAAPGATTQPFVDGTHLSMRGHVQRVGWQNSNEAVGTVGRGLRIEAFSAKLACGEHPGGVVYNAHVQRIGWQGERADGTYAGTTGRSLRIEAFTMALTGEAADYYDLWYRVHVQKFGWLGWAKNGDQAGTAGMSLRCERIETKILPKGSAAPQAEAGSVSTPFVAAANLSYNTKDVGASWQGERTSGATSGTTNDARSVEMFAAHVVSDAQTPSGGVSYRVRSLNGTWTESGDSGAAGVSGKAIDQMALYLTGDLPSIYSVYYRVHIAGVGWLQWASNSEATGTDGLGKSIDAVQAKIMLKGSAAPSNSDADKSTVIYDKAFAQLKGQPLAKANAQQQRIVNAALSTPSPGGGLCAAWVEDVYSNAGYGTFYGNADDLYYDYCHSSDLGNLKVGMIIAVSTHTNTYLGGIYGHVGIYVGDGWIMDNVGTIRKISVANWIDYYDTTVTPKWGWLGNINIA
ncbi:MAG: hypothetical protein Q4A01_00230 [Coriobacteriales bacterium]|nr:hypothetical protein [Coriobacteriales bacterium]